MTSPTSKTCLLLALILSSFTTSWTACSERPRVVSVIRVPTSCLETVGPKPIMKLQPDTRPAGCPGDMACLDVRSMLALGRYLRETLRWMAQVEIACAVERTTP